jgi:hypothetical protein
VPCIDSLWEKCTWEFEFVVPKFLQQEVEDVDGLDIDEQGDAMETEHPVVVICSGDLTEQVREPLLYLLLFLELWLLLDCPSLQLRQDHLPVFSNCRHFRSACYFRCWTFPRLAAPVQ